MPTSRIRLHSYHELCDISIKTAYEGTTYSAQNYSKEKRLITANSITHLTAIRQSITAKLCTIIIRLTTLRSIKLTDSNYRFQQSLLNIYRHAEYQN